MRPPPVTSVTVPVGSSITCRCRSRCRRCHPPVPVPVSVPVVPVPCRSRWCRVAPVSAPGGARTRVGPGGARARVRARTGAGTRVRPGTRVRAGARARARVRARVGAGGAGGAAVDHVVGLIDAGVLRSRRRGLPGQALGDLRHLGGHGLRGTAERQHVGGHGALDGGGGIDVGRDREVDGGGEVESHVDVEEQVEQRDDLLRRQHGAALGVELGPGHGLADLGHGIGSLPGAPSLGSIATVPAPRVPEPLV